MPQNYDAHERIPFTPGYRLYLPSSKSPLCLLTSALCLLFVASFPPRATESGAENLSCNRMLVVI